MMNDTPAEQPSKRLIVNARTTQEITFDKHVLAQQLQAMVEHSLPGAFGIHKEEIATGDMVYTVDYNELGFTVENYGTHALLDAEFKKKAGIKGLMSFEAVGHGKDIGVEFQVNLGAMMNQYTKPARVEGLDGSVPVPEFTEAPELFLSAFKPGEEGFVVDGQKLLASMQSVMSTLTQPQDAEQRQQSKDGAFAGMQFVSGLIPGSKATRDGNLVTMYVPLDAIFALAEKHLPDSLKPAVSVHRDLEAGKAIIHIDYEHLVDMAISKAQELAEKTEKPNRASVTRYQDGTVELMYSKGGLAGMLNNAVDQMAASMASKKAEHPAGIENLGTLAQEPVKRIGDGGIA